MKRLTSSFKMFNCPPNVASFSLSSSYTWVILLNDIRHDLGLRLFEEKHLLLCTAPVRALSQTLPRLVNHVGEQDPQVEVVAL
eukprot:1581302-Amphidinium_carterae.1